jgi:hypothetical protein
MKFKLMFLLKKTSIMPVDLAKMTAKFSKDLVLLVKGERREIFEIILETCPDFIDTLPDDFEYDSELPPVDILELFFDKKLPLSTETPKRKKRTTPKDKDGEPEQPRWIDPKDAIKSAMEALDDLNKNPGGIVSIPCLHIPNKGKNKNKACGKSCKMTDENKNIYSIKCPSCSRVNEPKNQESLRNHYNVLLQGEEAVCSPTSANCARLTGNDGRTTPDEDETSTPSDFINGKNEGLASPSEAKPKKKKSSPKLPKLESVKHDKKENFHDTVTAEPIDDHTWFVRKNTSPLSWSVIGKIRGNISGSELKKKVKDEDYDYLSKMIELNEDEVQRVKSDMLVNYEYLGTGGEDNSSEPEEEEDEEDNGSDMDDLLVELSGGK